MGVRVQQSDVGRDISADDEKVAIHFEWIEKKGWVRWEQGGGRPTRREQAIRVGVVWTGVGDFFSHKDVLRKDILHKDILHKDILQKDILHKDILAQDVSQV